VKRAPRWPDAFALAEGVYLAWVGAEDGVETSGQLVATSSVFELRGKIALPDEAQAADGERFVRMLLQKAAGTPYERLARDVTFDRKGPVVNASFALRGPPSEQLKEFGVLTQLARDGVRDYVTNAKTAEAKNALGQIAKSYATWYEMEDGTPRAKKKLFSCPPVPKTVPRGDKYASKPSDWKGPWEKLRFTIDAPQFFQYEVKAAKDGQSAEVLARGDLNGNGQTSLFKIHVELKETGSDRMFVIAPNIDETDPTE
jgi:hypothetical protein